MMMMLRFARRRSRSRIGSLSYHAQTEHCSQQEDEFCHNLFELRLILSCILRLPVNRFASILQPGEEEEVSKILAVPTFEITRPGAKILYSAATSFRTRPITWDLFIHKSLVLLMLSRQSGIWTNDLGFKSRPRSGALASQLWKDPPKKSQTIDFGVSLSNDHVNNTTLYVLYINSYPSLGF
jgi:hypothetical protein